MAGSLGLIIELIVVGLLAVTIGYCIVLDRRLKAVRADEQVMRKTVIELGAATERAERAIDALRHTLGDCDRTLAERLRVAERYATDLEDQIRSGDEVLTRITRIVSSAGEYGFLGVEAAAQASATSGKPGSRINHTLAAAQLLAAQAQSRATEAFKRESVA